MLKAEGIWFLGISQPHTFKHRLKYLIVSGHCWGSYGRLGVVTRKSVGIFHLEQKLKNGLLWEVKPDHAEPAPHSTVQNKLPSSIPSEDAGVIARVSSDRSLMLFHAHFPFTPKVFSEEQVSYSGTCLLWSNDMLSKEYGRVQSFSDQSCPRLLAKPGGSGARL